MCAQSKGSINSLLIERQEKNNVILMIRADFLFRPKYQPLTLSLLFVFNVNTFGHDIRNRYQLVISYVNRKHIGSTISKMFTLFKWYQAISMQNALHFHRSRIFEWFCYKSDIISTVLLFSLASCSIWSLKLGIIAANEM